jgi:7-keto-8-aminopelargonate synthetase-like enzyme
MGVTFDPSCIAAGQQALAAFGTGTTGSRIANGTYDMHLALERELADFLGRRHCIVFSTGYQANLGMISGLAGPKDTIYLDADSHSSIYDGCTLSRAQLVRFRHNDPEDLDRRLARADGQGGRLVVLEGIYSMLGDRPPLAEFIEVKRRHGFQLLVDEAHSFGVLGRDGRGLAEEAGLEEECDFIVGTFSKSIGAIGGFGAGNHPMFEMLRYAMRPYMFTASSSPASIATSLQALRVLKGRPELRERTPGELRAAVQIRIGCLRPSPSWPGCGRTSLCHAACALEHGVYVNMAIPPERRVAGCACCGAPMRRRCTATTSTRSSRCSPPWCQAPRRAANGWCHGTVSARKAMAATAE